MRNGKLGTIVRMTALALTTAAGASVVGCAPQVWRNADGTVVTGKVDFQREPATGRTYHLYIPTWYTPDRKWPLVITAQGTFPFDQAAGQRDRWIDVAEREGMIVCAPDFDSATGWLGISRDHVAPELVRDERATLAIINELSKRYMIDPDAILITGWSGGGYPAHFIGLRHPDVFRAIVGRTANFSPDLVDDATARRARHIHAYFFFGEVDLPGWDTMNRQANFWYTTRGFRNFQVRRLPGGHNPNQEEAARYFLDIVRHWPVVHIRAAPVKGRAPLTVRLQADVRDPDAPDNRIDSVLWNLGDSSVAVTPDVTHTYQAPGTYNVFLTVKDLDGHQEYAQTWITVE